MRLKRALAIVVVAVVAVAAVVAIPIVHVERSCFAATPAAPAVSLFGIPDKDYRRAEGDSFLSYPEWYIVHAYADLAGVTGQSSESGFDYLASIRGFWSSLCRATATASRIGPITDDQKTTNYIIGVSFSAEMALQGLYERSIGAVTAWLRGPQRTAEDDFNLRLLREYAAFLQQTPWYEYPFGAELTRFWRETPFHWSVRSIDRRFALTLQYAVKSAYAAVIRYAASYAPADLKLRSVVANVDAAALAGDTRITKLGDVTAQDGSRGTLIETPRYQVFTEIIRALGARGGVFREIAGNHRILTTVLVPPDKALSPDQAREIFSIPIQSRPGWRRVGYDTAVTALAAQVGAVEREGASFEHAYDY